MRRDEGLGLNDGLLEYGKLVTKRDEETAKKTGEEFAAVGSLFFGYKTINARFDSFQVSSLSQVDIKVKCYFVSDFQKSHKVRIKNSLYEVEAMDVEPGQVFMYLFLRKVGEWDGGHYVQTA